MFILKLYGMYVEKIDRTVVYCGKNPHKAITYPTMAEATLAIPEYLIPDIRIVKARNVFRRYDTNHKEV